MSRLAEKFEQLAAGSEKALITFVTAGDPDIDQLSAILAALEQGGADIIEIGIPFSDPIADGPTIQASSQRALERGITPTAVLKAVSDTKVSVPVVFMGYYNPMLRMGLGSFARRVADVGGDGVIVSDIIPEEAQDWKLAANLAGVDTVMLAAPTSTDERLNAVCDAASGFVYAVSRTGVTGAAQSAQADVTRLVSRLRARTRLPICVGFGISKPEHVREVCRVADGAVVGSSLVQLIHERWKEGRGRAQLVETISALKAATREGAI